MAAIHHPMDSRLLIDAVRMLSRVIRRSKPLVQDQFRTVRDAFRSRLRTMRRGLGEDQAERRKAAYETLLLATDAAIQQAERIRDALRGVRHDGKSDGARAFGEVHGLGAPGGSDTAVGPAPHKGDRREASPAPSHSQSCIDSHASIFPLLHNSNGYSYTS